MIVSRSARALRTTLAFVLACAGLTGTATAGPARNFDLGKADRPTIYRPLPASFPVAIRQAPAQADPTGALPIVFEVLFDQAIFPGSFEPSDILQLGSATGVSWAITPVGDDKNFILEATAVDFSPTAVTLIPTLPAGAVQTPGSCSAASVNPGDPCGSAPDCPGGACIGGDENQASVSVDNSVTFGIVSCSTLTYLYVASWSPPVIDIYCVEAAGTLTHEGSVAAPADVRDLQINAGGEHLYYASADLTKYYVSTDGSIVEAGTLSVGGGSLYDLAFGPAGRFLYATHSADKLHVYDTFVATTLPDEIQVVGGLVSPHGVALTPSGSQVFVANQWSFFGDPDAAEEIVTFARNADGTLDLGSKDQSDWLARPDFFAVHPSLPYLYHTDRPGGSLAAASIGGGVSQGDSVFSGFGATQLVINSSGTRVYVTNYNDDDLSVFAIDGGGQPSLLATAPTGDRPEHLILHPNGLFLYAVSAGGPGGVTEVSVYSVAGDGTLTEIGPPVVSAQGGYRLSIVDLSP